MLDLSVLNPEQREAVAATEGPLLVLAGAGTGKTRVITYRIAHLIDRGVAARNILAVTFTNKAAAEMRQRVAALLRSNTASELTICTFHALGLKILREHPREAGLRPAFTIYTTSNQLGLVRESLRELALAGSRADPQGMLTAISLAKNAGHDPASLAELAGSTEQYLRAGCYARYQEKLRLKNVVDFDDLLLLPLRMLRQKDSILAKYHERFRYILIDEYQDTNGVQHELVKLLAGARHNVCAVGDDDQSIYAWRGARPQNVVQFQRDFPGTRVVKLERNYRSTPQILDVANAVLAGATDRIEKRLYTALRPGPKVELLDAEDEEAEAETVAKAIRDSHVRKGVAWGDHAVIYRANAQSRPFEEQMRRWQIPYVVIGGQSFFERREILDVLAYLHVLANPADDLSFRRILNTPPRGIGAKAVNWIEDLAASRRISLREALAVAAEAADTPSSVRPPLARFHEQLAGWAGRMQPGQCAQTARALLDDINYQGELARLYDSDSAVVRWEGVQGLLASLARAEDSGRGLSGFLDEASLLNDDEESARDKDSRISDQAVTLITIHSCKGLEFRYVFLVGCEDGILPHRRSIRDADTESLAEERRLCYVAVTRARERLTLLRAKVRKGRGGPPQAGTDADDEPQPDRRPPKGRKPVVETTLSRFFQEIPDGLIVRRHDGLFRSGDDPAEVRGACLDRVSKLLKAKPRR